MMKNSDLFLELFDDDLLKPEGNFEAEENGEISGKCDKPSNDASINDKTPPVKPTRTDFDLCSALDKAKEEEAAENVKTVTKEGKLKVLADTKGNSLIHSGDTDSSEDEDNRYFESCNYNESGRNIKRLLQSTENDSTQDEIKSDVILNPSAPKWNKQTNSKQPKVKQMALPVQKPSKTIDVYADPIFGIRIVNPLISSQGIQIRMSGKSPVLLSKLQAHIAKKLDSDWVIAGVLVRAVTKQSQNDTQYMIWEMSDLKDDLLSVSVFLFGRCYKELWKTPVGTVIAILNPTGSSKKGSDGSESLSLSVKFPDQVMIWGQSKDYGTCKSLKKSGEKCTSFVNRNRCEYCVYHIKKEYSKLSSSRSEIQSPMGGRNMNFLRNKVLGKNEVFYGGKSYTSMKPPAETAKKVNPKDKQRLSTLGYTVFENKPQTKEKSFSLPYAPRGSQALKTLNMDSQILKSLSSSPSNNIQSNLSTSKSNKPINEKMKTPSQIMKEAKPPCENKKILKQTRLGSDFISKTEKCPVLNDPESDLNSKVNSNLKAGMSKYNLNDQSSPSLKDVKNKTPSLSNPEIIEKSDTFLSKLKSNNEASPTNKVKKKIEKCKPSLSNPEVDETFENSPKSDGLKKKIKEVTVNKESTKKISDKKKTSVINHDNETDKFPQLIDGKINNVGENIFFENDNSAKKSGVKKSLSLTNPEMDFDDTKMLDDPSSKEGSGGDGNSRDLQKRFKSLMEVSSGPTKGTENKDNERNDICTKSDGAEEKNIVFSNDKPVAARSSIPSSGAHYSGGFQNPATSKISRAKARALMFVKRNGPITKADPNSVKNQPEPSKKRERSDSVEDEDGKPAFSELYMQLMKQTSQQFDLVEAEKMRMEEEYFEKMGLKEQLEEKMLNTFKIDCKAVKCLQCKYIWFSASDICKAERHTLKIVDTVKRFFKCGNCSNRTVSLHILPMFSCKNCQGSNWQRAPMIREKITKTGSQLSIRGGEHKFTNGQFTNSNLNLLVPD